MPVYFEVPHRDYEESLRSLGGLFDEQRLEDILLVERESGFLMTGLRRAEPAGPHVGAAGALRIRRIHLSRQRDRGGVGARQGAPRLGP